MPRSRRNSLGKNLAIKDLLEYRREQHEQYLQKKREEHDENVVAMELVNTNPFNLEDNVMLKIFSFLEGEYILNVISRVCFSWFRISNTPKISKSLWEEIFKRRFTSPLSTSLSNNNNTDNDNITQHGIYFNDPSFWKNEFIARAKCRRNWKQISCSTIYLQNKPVRKNLANRRHQLQNVNSMPTCVRMSGTNVYVGNQDGTVTVYSTLTEMKERTIRTQIHSPVYDIYLKDHRMYISLIDTSQIIVFSTRKWKCIGAIGNEEPWNYCFCMSVSSDRRYLAAAYLSGNAKLWDLRDGSLVINLSSENEQGYVAIYNNIFVRCSVSKATVFDLEAITRFREKLKDNPEIEDQVLDEENPLHGFQFDLKRPMTLFSICINCQGTVMLAVASENKIRIYNTDGTVRFSFKHRNMIIGFIADKRGLVSLSNDGILKAWDLERGDIAFKLNLILTASYFEPRVYLFGEMIFVHDSKCLLVYDRFNGNYITTIPLPPDTSFIEADEARLLIGTESGIVKLQDFGEGIMNWQGVSGGRRLGGE